MRKLSEEEAEKGVPGFKPVVILGHHKSIEDSVTRHHYLFRHIGIKMAIRHKLQAYLDEMDINLPELCMLLGEKQRFLNAYLNMSTADWNVYRKEQRLSRRIPVSDVFILTLCTMLGIKINLTIESLEGYSFTEEEWQGSLNYHYGIEITDVPVAVARLRTLANEIHERKSKPKKKKDETAS